MKVSKYGVISGSYFPVFGPNTGKYRPEITPYLDAFHTVLQSYAMYLIFDIIVQKVMENTNSVV